MQSSCRTDSAAPNLAEFLEAHEFPGSARIPIRPAFAVDTRSKVAAASTEAWTRTPCGDLM